MIVIIVLMALTPKVFWFSEYIWGGGGGGGGLWFSEYIWGGGGDIIDEELKSMLFSGALRQASKQQLALM